MSLVVQEVLALVIVAAAAVYLVARLTGWPRLERLGIRRKKACGPTSPDGAVVLGERLKRGLRDRR